MYLHSVRITYNCVKSVTCSKGDNDAHVNLTVSQHIRYYIADFAVCHAWQMNGSSFTFDIQIKQKFRLLCSHIYKHTPYADTGKKPNNMQTHVFCMQTRCTSILCIYNIVFDSSAVCMHSREQIYTEVFR